MSEPAAHAIPTHPKAADHLPSFVTAPGDTDVLMVVTAVILLLGVVGFGLLFLRLHSLPERIAHKGHKIQFEIVAVLCLIALFTHIHLFWMIALMLALIELPDFSGLLARMAAALEIMAGRRSRQNASEPEGEAAPEGHGEGIAKPDFEQADTLVPLADAKPRKERTHA